ncbi:MAG: hypothetical protein K5984_06960, partial [Bacteroidales bacterium]|nr:hypothetical protein [Bacteroidales bacterium]
MKKILLAMTAILMMLSSFELSAQKNKWGTTADSTVCKNNLSFYLDYVNQKQWLSALPSWRKAYKACPPTASQNLYIHGARIIREAIKVEKDKTHKAALIDTLMDIYKIRINTYTAPKHSVKARNSYALDYSFYFRNDYEGIYAVTNETIEANQE